MCELKEQIQLAEHACSKFDEGFEVIGKHIALSLRVLLHHKNQSRSLLEQLGLRSGRYLDTAGPLNPRNLLPEHNLVSIQMVINAGVAEAQYRPVGDSPRGDSWVPFQDWWNEPVLKDSKNRTFNRRDIILNVADTDGGAHVDPELDDAYMALSRSNSLGWTFATGIGDASPLQGRPELACVRQICHELLRTLRKRHPSLFEP